MANEPVRTTEEPQGGSFIVGEDGQRRRVGEPAKPSSAGASGADGKPIDPALAGNSESFPPAPKHKPWESPPAAAQEQAPDAAGEDAKRRSR